MSNNLTSQYYIKELTDGLGTHFYFETYSHPEDSWVGFIYCCCYAKPWEEPRHRIPGAIARLEPRSLVLIDTRRRRYANGDLINNDSCDDAEVPLGDPEFHIKFKELIPWHDKMATYFNTKLSSSCGTMA